MKLRVKGALDRRSMAGFLAATIGGKEYVDIPYMPNDHDDYWTVDSGNNWKVKYFDDEPDVMQITYRYQCNDVPYEQALAAWLKMRLDVTIINVGVHDDDT